MKMTKNEYQKYAQKCANRFYNESGYTRKDFDADLDAVEVLPFNLSAFPQLSENAVSWINALFSSEKIDKNGNYMLRGRTYYEVSEMQVLNLHYGDYGRSLSFWGYNDEEMLIYTYCEGDTTLTIFSKREVYEQEKEETLNWYKAAS